MKTISKSVFTFLSFFFIACGAASGQITGKMGFVRLVNAVAPGTGKLEISVAGKSLNPNGYDFGDVTGGIGLKAGSHDITISREGTKAGTTKVNVANDETTILIPFAERVPASDDEPAHWAIRVLRLKQRDTEEGKSATFVSVSQNPEVRVEIRDPEGKWSSVFVKRLSIAQAPIRYPRGYVPLKSKDGDLQSIPVSMEGNYVVVLYDDPDGKLKSLNFLDQKFLSAD